MGDNGLRIEKLEADVARLKRLGGLTSEYLINLTDLCNLINDKTNDLKKFMDLQERINDLKHNPLMGQKEE